MLVGITFPIVVAFFFGLFVVECHVLAVVRPEQRRMDRTRLIGRWLHMDGPTDGHVSLVGDAGLWGLLVIRIGFEDAQIPDDRVMTPIRSGNIMIVAVMDPLGTRSVIRVVAIPVAREIATTLWALLANGTRGPHIQAATDRGRYAREHTLPRAA